MCIILTAFFPASFYPCTTLTLALRFDVSESRFVYLHFLVFARSLNARRDLRRFNLLHSFLDDPDGCFADDNGGALFGGGGGGMMQPLLPSSIRYARSLPR